MPDCCICLTTDEAYLFPTLLAASQARAHSTAGLADVVVLGFGIPTAAEDAARRVCAAEGVAFAAHGGDAIDGRSPMLARLFLDRLLPAGYRRVLYLDGDVQVSASLDPLLSAAVPAGGFLAAPDPMAFMLDAAGQGDAGVAAHMRRIGFDAARVGGYLNSGVLLIAREGWAALAAETLALVEGKGSRFPDQDALNLAAAGRGAAMSLRWNFPVFLRNVGLQREIRPAVTHFMSQPKPWQGDFLPWDRESHLAYVRFGERHPGIAGWRAGMSPLRWARYQLQQRMKRVQERQSWGGARRARVLAFEAELAPSSNDALAYR